MKFNRDNTFKKSLVSSAILSIGVAFPACPLYAQDSLQLEEVVVVARKREENLQDVPAAVSVMAESQIERQRIFGTQDLALRIPTFNINAATTTQVTPGLRGATSNNTSPGGDQSVGLFVDEVYYGGSADWNPDLFDVVRIEVLRGPQGTLFGRNVVGGALNVITRTPDEEFYGKVEIGVGSENLVEMGGLISGPIGGNWYGQLAANVKSRDGLSKNTYVDPAGNAGNENETDTIDRQNLRAKLRWASDNLEWIGTVGFSRDKSHGPARDFVGPALPESVLPLETQIRNGFPDNDPDTTASSEINHNDAEYQSYVSRFTWNSDVGELVAITAYRDVKNDESGADIFGAPIDNHVEVPNYEEVEQFSQEIRFSGMFGEKFEYTTGVYYMKQEALNEQPFYLTLVGGTFLGSILGLPDQALHRTASQQNMQVDTTSWAAFVHGTYDLTDSLRLSVGVRHTQDEKEGWASVSEYGGLPDNFIFPTYPRVALDEDWSKTTPKISIDWAASEDVMLYALYSEGFKSGAFDHGASGEDTRIALDIEEAESLEIGGKAEFFNNRAQVNVAAYRVDYTGAQNGFFDPEQSRAVLVNLGDLEVTGVELDLTALVSEGLTIGASLAWTDSEVAEDAPEFPGNKAALTPDFGGNIWFTYDIDLGDHGTLSFAADATYKDDYFLEISNAENFRTEIDGLFNASIEYRPTDSMNIRLWGKNLSDERYMIYSNDLSVFGYPRGYPGSAEARMPSWNEARTFGISFTMDF